MSKQRKIKITDIQTVEREGPFRMDRIDPTSYGHDREEWFAEFGQWLPNYDYLPRFGDPEELRVLSAEKLTGTITFSDSSWIQYQFRRGFITDLASVPKQVRSLIDNDDLRMLLAALIHDRNFSSHVLPFSDTNRLFYKMLRERGYPLPKSVLAFLAVSSPVGRSRWKETRSRDPWTEETSSFMSSSDFLLVG